jgi:hypothetical protein
MSAPRTKAELLTENQHLQERVRIHEQMIADLLAERERLTAPSIEWLSLKQCPHGPFTYECLRNWCETGVVNAKKEHGRWLVDVASLRKHLPAA